LYILGSAGDGFTPGTWYFFLVTCIGTGYQA